MKKGLIALMLLAMPAFADESLLETRAREYNTPRKTERFMQNHYQNCQDIAPVRLNSTEEFLTTGLGDEKELVNAAADMMQKNGYVIKKMYYKTASGIERYYAYVADPPQQNNYLLHLEWQTTMVPRLVPYQVVEYHHHHARVRTIFITVYEPHSFIGPKLVTGLGSETDAKTYLQQNESVIEWGQFEYNTQNPNGMKKTVE